jgi:NADH-quinone oxidoreductase subunit N
MSGADLLALLPFLVMGVAVIAVMLAAAFHRRHRLVAMLALAGVAATLAALWPAAATRPRQVTPLLVIDGYALFFMGLFLAAALAVLLLSYEYMDRRGQPPEEFHLLVLLATFGAMAMVASNHVASFFVGLETLSIALPGLIAYPRERHRPVEAGLKYLFLAGLSSAFLLFGVALVYARLGTLDFAAIALRLNAAGPAADDAYWLTGLALLFTGFGFKLSVVPFHMWAPDVYEGAPAPVAAFVAVVSKGAALALLLRYFLTAGGYASGSVLVAIQVVAVASMLAGNLLALLQNNVKRLLAYSSIAHLGYLLVALLAGGRMAAEAVAYYLAAYSVMTLGAFGVIAALSASGGEEDVDTLESYGGLLWRRPWLGACFTIMLLSLAGFPLTMGFFAKYYALTAGVDAALWPAVAALVAGSVIGLFYYLRLVVVMCMPRPEGTAAPSGHAPRTAAVTLAALSVVLIWLGVYPASFIAMVRTAVDVVR